MTSLVACNNPNAGNVKVSAKHREIIEKSIDAIKVKWKTELDHDGVDKTIDNKKVKIVNTMIYELKSDVTLEDCTQILWVRARSIFSVRAS